jgi:DNA repair protein RecO (recombination protein O)
VAVPPRAWTAEAIVLRVVPFRETSQVVHLATAEHGRVAALAKGACRPGGDFQGGLSLGTVGEARVHPRRAADLDLLTAFRLRRGVEGLASDLDRFRAACHVLELLRTWMQPALPSPPLFAAGLMALRAIGSASRETLGQWVAWFEARAVAATGHRPVLASCAGCGEEVSPPAVFAPGVGGLAHARCAGEGPRTRLKVPVLAALRRLYTARVGDLVRTPLDPRAVAGVRAVHDQLLAWLLERRPRTIGHLPR